MTRAEALRSAKDQELDLLLVRKAVRLLGPPAALRAAQAAQPAPFAVFHPQHGGRAGVLGWLATK